jgi:ADP-ribosylglycohydrolase
MVMATRIITDCVHVSSTELRIELLQLEDEGRDTRKLKKEFERLIALGDESLLHDVNQQAAFALLDRSIASPTVNNYAYVEPNDLESIRKQSCAKGPSRKPKINSCQIEDRIHGAWLGRCLGCYLGKPLEGIKSRVLWPFLKDTGQWPLRYFVQFPTKLKSKKLYEPIYSRLGLDPTPYMPVDDDTNYTMVGLLVLERHGREFTPADVANFWLERLPVFSTWTAGRVAFRNFLMQIQPPQSGQCRNPYREFIGAQIRADGFAYAAAANPYLASEFAWRDACISHAKNGIYGEMFMAACIAAAAYCTDAEEVLRVGLAHIPSKSRLHEWILRVIGWFHDGISYDDAVAMVHQKWDEMSAYHWVHTISNAAICAIALLWGKGDFAGSICKAVQPCFDTDCNGATVGSIVGMMSGAGAIPSAWSRQLHDTLHTSLQGNEVVKISDMAQRAVKIWKAIHG